MWGSEVELRVGLSCGASRDNDTGREGGEVVGALPCRDDAWREGEVRACTRGGGYGRVRGSL